MVGAAAALEAAVVVDRAEQELQVVDQEEVGAADRAA